MLMHTSSAHANVQLGLFMHGIKHGPVLLTPSMASSAVHGCCAGATRVPHAVSDAVTRWRNRALRFVLPSDSNAPDVVSKPAAGDQSEGEDVRQWQKQAAACCATFSHNTYTATCCSCCLHCAMIFSRELSLLKRVTLLLPSLRCMQTFGSEHDSHAIDGDQRRPAASVL